LPVSLELPLQLVMTAYDLAHIVTHYVNQKGDSVSHKKLQKLLYYVEAWHLVHMGGPILDEEFEAWVHGPVIPSLYQSLKQYGFNDLNVIHDVEGGNIDKLIDDIIKNNDLSEDQQDLIEQVLDKYGIKTSFALEMMTHQEAPWVEARGGIPPHQNCNTIISKERMKQFYSSLIDG
jgi:uncharacterized phage-associated protein